jgi:cytochrome b6-f complex iron-sulfur subunit
LSDSRRSFLKGLGGLGVLTGLGATAIHYARPEIFYGDPTRICAGRPEDLPVGALLVVKEAHLFVLHSAEGFLAMSTVCTHLGCFTRHEPEKNRIFCPCHGAEFALDGAVQRGPALRPLRRLRVTLEQGELVVHTAQTVGREEVLRV